MTKAPFPEAATTDAVAKGVLDFRRIHITMAQQELLRASRGDDAWRKPRIFTDGRPRKPLTAIEIFGRVEWNVGDLRGAATFIFAELQKLALKIRDQGEYQKSMMIWDATSRKVISNPALLSPDTQEVHFFPSIIYAMKIENGQSSGARRGVYKPTWRKARTQFKGLTILYDATVPPGVPKVWRTSTKTARESGLPVPRIKLRGART